MKELYRASAFDFASLSSFGSSPVWSNGPVRKIKSVFRASVLTQCACSESVRMSFPFSLFQSLTVRSLLAVYMTPSPPHRTAFTDAVCPPSVKSTRRAFGFQIRTVASLLEDARRGSSEVLDSINSACFPSDCVTVQGAYKCTGSQAKPVIHFV